MKKYRICYLLLIIAAGALCLAYQSRLSPLLLAFLIILPLLSLLLMVAAYFTIELEIQPTEVITEKMQDFKLNIKIRNRFIFPAAPIKITGLFNDGKTSRLCEKQIIVGVPPLKSISVSFGGAVKYRGEYTAGIRELEIFDIFKLFSIKKKVDICTRVVVLPREIPVGNVQSLSDAEIESTSASHSFINQTAFSSLREYREGDNLRHVHWKLSAKSDELVVKQMEQNLDANALIICDLNLYSQDEEAALSASDTAIEAALSISRHIVNIGNSALNIWRGGSGEALSLNVETIDDYRRLYYLYSIVPNSTPKQDLRDFPEILDFFRSELYKPRSIYIITPQLTAELAECLSRLGLNGRRDIALLLTDPMAAGSEITESFRLQSTVGVYFINEDELSGGIAEAIQKTI